MEAAELERAQLRNEEALRDSAAACDELSKLTASHSEMLREMEAGLARQDWILRFLGVVWAVGVVLVLGMFLTGCAGAPFTSSGLDGSAQAGAQSSAGMRAAVSSAGRSGGAGGASGAGAGGSFPEILGGSAGEPAELLGGDGGQGAGGAGGVVVWPCVAATWKASAFASSSAPPSTPALAVDDDSHTRWTSGEARQAGQWFGLELGAGVVLEQLELRAGEAFTDMPRAATLELDGVRVDAAAAGVDGVLRFTFAPTLATSARVVLTDDAVSWWSIADVGGLCK